jgi:hypothetical protein
MASEIAMAIRAAFPSVNGSTEPRPCSAGTLFSGKIPTITTPSPERPMAENPAAAIRPFP